MMKRFNSLSLISIFTLSLSMSGMAAQASSSPEKASAGPRAHAQKPVKPSKLSKKQQETVRRAKRHLAAIKVMDGFERRHGTAFEFVQPKSAWLERLERELNLFPTCEAYSEGDICMVAGWTGTYRSSRCRITDEGRAENAGVLVALNCSSVESVACNPEIFGKTTSELERQMSTLNDGVGRAVASLVTAEGSTAQPRVAAEPRRTSPVCVPRTERRMTLGCMRASMTAAGVNIPEPALSDINQFEAYLQASDESGREALLSGADLARWFEFLESSTPRLAGLAGQSALEAASRLCSSISRGDRRAETGGIQEVEKTTEQVQALLERDRSRWADYNDCGTVTALLASARDSAQISRRPAVSDRHADAAPTAAPAAVAPAAAPAPAAQEAH